MEVAKSGSSVPPPNEVWKKNLAMNAQYCEKIEEVADGAHEPHMLLRMHESRFSHLSIFPKAASTRHVKCYPIR